MFVLGDHTDPMLAFAWLDVAADIETSRSVPTIETLMPGFSRRLSITPVTRAAV